MEIIFLGTSSAVPTTSRNHASIALKAFGELFLFDCGEGTQRQMANIKISPMKINYIFISHLHGDHILGLPGLIQSMGFRGRTNPLYIFGPPGINSLKTIFTNLRCFHMPFEIIIRELEEGCVIDNEEYHINCIKCEHNIINYAYSIIEKKKPRFLREKAIELGIKPGPDYSRLHNGEEIIVKGNIIKPEQVLGPPRKGIKITYSGDTRPCQTLINFAHESTVLIHESTFEDDDLDKAIENAHSTVSEAANIAKEADVEKLILTHISARYSDTKKMQKSAKKIFNNVIIAKDYMKLEVK